MPSWRTAYASVTGTSHAVSGAPCQDAGHCKVVVGSDGSEILLAAVADGAGSAARSDEGAHLAVRMFLSDFGTVAANDPTLSGITGDLLVSWLGDLRVEIAEMAEAGGNAFSDYACTFLAAIVGSSRAIFMQIGDGAIVVMDPEEAEYSWMFWPQHGEFANTTNFVTQDDFERALEIEFVERAVTEVAIFSDGIERLVLDLTSKTVHTPALRPIFKWLAGTSAHVATAGAAAGLVAFLGSDKVNQRTDDDKTLVMATRAVPAPVS